MMYEEFEKITGLEISYRDYSEVIEPMYGAVQMDKYRFCEMIKPTAKLMAKQYAEERKAQEMRSQRKEAWLWRTSASIFGLTSMVSV